MNRQESDKQQLDKYFLASVVESSNDSIITVNFDSIITSWNKAAEQLYGYPAKEAIGKHMTMLTLDEDFDEVHSNIDKVKHSKQVITFQTERRSKKKDHLFLEVVMSPVKDDEGKVIGVSTVARDTSERSRAERVLNEKRNLQRLIKAQEEERERIARDLHDEFGQQFIALKLKLDAAKNLCQDDGQKGIIEEVQTIADNIDKGIDFLAWKIRPNALDILDLTATIKSYVEQWSRHSGITAQFLKSSLKKARFAPGIETNLYRILQEILNNIYKHAEAENVEVIFDKRDDLIVLIVGDDGKGFSLKDKKKPSKGSGLSSMRKRAALMGGTLEIESAPGKGTTVFVRIQASAMQTQTAKS